MLSTALFALALLPFTSAGYIVAKTHEVVVGGPGKLLFTPEYISAQPGDTVRFIFKQKNHTVTQSTFDKPCGALAGGFDSGYKPVPDTQADNFPYVNVAVKDSAPAWFYCAQGPHCTAGMVFAINPEMTGKTFPAFKAKAQAGAAPPASSAPASTGYAYPDPYPTAPATSAAPAPTAPAAAAPVNHQVVVGGTGGLVYTPSTVTAKKGDTVTFVFHQKNHTVTQSSFDNPCRKLEATTTPVQIGFDSGFIPVAADVTANFPTWVYTVEDDTKPIWAYCAQGTHCSAGMVFAINPTVTGKTFDAFVSNAKAAPAAGTPAGAASPTGTSAGQAPGVNSAAGLSSGSALVTLFAVAGVFASLL